MEIELTETEKKVLELLRLLQPYGKLEISMNQSGSQISLYLTNPKKEVIMVKKKQL